MLYQLVTVICGFILPRFMLKAFGSEVNGAVTSIAQFLGYISLLEAGVGGVTRAALYKPLAEGDKVKINGIVNATQSFFRKMAFIFVVYATVLTCSFKYISNTALDWAFIAGLVLVLSISTFSQYYFGMTYSVLLQADQSNYISNTLSIVTVILNTIISIVLIKLGCGVHIVKLASVTVYFIRPLFLNIVARRKFEIKKDIAPDNTAIKQRWNGFGHHIAFYIHNNVDVMVITILLGLKYSSVYAVYSMILIGIKNIVNSLSGGSEAAFGDMIAKNEKSILKNRFAMIETLTSVSVVTLFTTAGILIFDFIRIYTSGINDVNYIIVPFGILFAISEGLHCIKQNYHSIVLAAGHYKQTQIGAFIEAGINVVLSIALSFFIGISGIVAATIISTLYRLIEYVIYLRKNILERSIKDFIVRFSVNCMSSLSAVLICLILPFSNSENYIAWFFKAIFVFSIVAATVFIWNIIFYRKTLFEIVRKIIKMFFKKIEKH